MSLSQRWFRAAFRHPWLTFVPTVVVTAMLAVFGSWVLALIVLIFGSANSVVFLRWRARVRDRPPWSDI